MPVDSESKLIGIAFQLKEKRQEMGSNRAGLKSARTARREKAEVQEDSRKTQLCKARQCSVKLSCSTLAQVTVRQDLLFPLMTGCPHSGKGRCKKEPWQCTHTQVDSQPPAAVPVSPGVHTPVVLCRW